MGVGGELLHPEEGVGVAGALALLHVTLIGQKRGALGEEDRKRCETCVGARVAGLAWLTWVVLGVEHAGQEVGEGGEA